MRLARAAGWHGIYVYNALRSREGAGFVFGPEREVATGLCWFGPRGNLVVVGGEGDSAGVVEQIRKARQPWRIAMGPAAVIDALRDHLVGAPLVHRDQVYYGGDAADGAAVERAETARRASPGDRDRLAQAALQLNRSDLHIEPARVDRRWLYETIDQRIAEGSTWVAGPNGAIACKLDLGSRGPGGVVVEGVFTFPEERGRGWASSLVASCMAAQTGVTALHVAADNVPAHRAYERAGMRRGGGCRLLLCG